MPSCDCHIEIKNKAESRVLISLLSINAFMFILEITLGIISNSTALIADSLDMLADAGIYAIALYAVGKAAIIKIKAAYLSGLLQIALGGLVLIDISRRFILGSEPESILMISVGILALIANIICLRLIAQHKDAGVHMRASWIFSKNDVIANIGIIIAGILVYWLDSKTPDLVIGFAIAIMVMHGGLHILKEAKAEQQIH